MSFDIYLSCASDEFGDLRLILGRYLERAGASAVVQDSFAQTDSDTLGRISDLISHCRAVIHFVGEYPGSSPSICGIKSLASHLEQSGRPIVKHLPELEGSLSGAGVIETLTYTQWEAILALHHDVPLFIYATPEGAERQKDHLARLRLGDVLHYATVTTSKISLTGTVMADLKYFLRKSPTRIPQNLPPSVGSGFVGRPSDLEAIAETLAQEQSTAVTISGPGGIGKTRLVIEYAHQNADIYTALLFCHGDSPDDFAQNLAELASPDILDLPEFESELPVCHQAVLTWLKRNKDWLLIFDSVDHPDTRTAITDLLSQSLPGYVLITTRLAAWPLGITELQLSPLPSAATRELFIDFSGKTMPFSVEEEAALKQLIDYFGGHALAIEQAGAHIARSQIDFVEYLHRFEDKRAELLASGDHLPGIYPESVATTLRNSIEQVSPAAGELLRELSFYAPAPIPRAIYEQVEGPLLELQTYSLLRLDRRPFPCINVHHVVLGLAQTWTSEAEAADLWQTHLARLYSWAPKGGQAPETWEKWGQFQPHSETWISHLRDLPKEADILDGFAGYEIFRNADYQKGEPLLRRALAIDKANFGENHPKVSIRLNNLARMLQATNRFTEAEILMRQMVENLVVTYGNEHPNIASALNNLATLLLATNRFEEAEPLMRRALAIDEESFGENHPNVATDLLNLAALLQGTNRLEEAEPMIRRAHSIDEASFGNNHPNVARSLNNLAQLLQSTNRLEEAEPLMRRALAIDEASFGENHPEVSAALNNLAQLLKATNRREEAEPLMRRALAIDEASFGDNHPNVAIRLNNLATLLQSTNRLEEAEPLMRQALAIDEASFGENHPNVAIRLNNLATLLQSTNRLEEAESLMRRALAIDEASFGENHPNVGGDLNNLAMLLQSDNRLEEAEPMMRRMLTIFVNFTRATGHRHPHLQAGIANYKHLLTEMGLKEEETEVKIAEIVHES